MDVFPSPYVHIGGDEVPTTEWERSPRARARAAREALAGPRAAPLVHRADLAPPTPEAASRLLGARGQLWTEFVRTPEHIEYLTYPRLCALADRVWAGVPHADPRPLPLSRPAWAAAAEPAGGRPPVVPPHRAPPTEASAQAGAVPKGTA